MEKQIEIKKGEESNKLKLMRDLMMDIGLEDFFEIIKDVNADSARKLFGADEKMVSKKNFKATLKIEIID